MTYNSVPSKILVNTQYYYEDSMKIGGEQAWERETVINFSDSDPGVIYVWTSQRRIGQWLESVAKTLQITVKKTGRPSWEAQLPSALITLRKRLRKNRTPEQRAAAAERLARARQTKNV